jgi:hypothetical protein
VETIKEIEVQEIYGYRYVSKKLVGEVIIELPPPPPLEEIQNWDKPIKDQKLQREKFWTKEDFIKQPADTRYKYLEQMWKIRRDGMFFLNNGNIEWLTGIHWFFINCFNDNGRQMRWIDGDSTFWHLWNWVEHNDKCTGLIYCTSRRDGKTSKALNILLEYATSEYHAKCGMQSKTSDDSSEYFERLVYAWTKLPFFFKPIHTGVKNPKTELVFAEPSTRATKNNDFEYYKVLGSNVNFKNSKEKAYDGTALNRVFHDEVGKTVEANVKKRYDVVRPCLMEGLTKIIGKILLVTTVEDEDGEARGKKQSGLGQSVLNFKELWDGADISNLDKNGMTQTGLVRYFKSATYGLRDFVDEYGYSNMTAANEYIDNTLANLKGDAALAFRRKYPREVEDMFGTMAGGNGLDTNKIMEQVYWNKAHANNDTEANIKIQRGNFEWYDQPFGAVRWIPLPEGKFNVYWMPSTEDRNKWTIRNGKPYPANYHSISVGCDPVDAAATTEDTKSNFAAVGFRKGSLMEDDVANDCFVFTYCCRLTHPETHFEDVLKAAIFYGAGIMVENNRQYFKQWLYNVNVNYLMPRPQQTAPEGKILSIMDYGIPNTGDRVRDLLVGYLTSYVYDNCGYNDETGQMGNVYFSEILQDWLQFRPENRWTKYDLTVACMMALAAAKGTSSYRRIEKPKPVLNLPKFDNTGTRSKRL